MTTTKNTETRVPDSAELALAVLIERIRTLPQEDKDDLFELSKIVFSDADEEELGSARLAMQEILDQQTSGIVPMQTIKIVGDELGGWVAFVGNRIKEKRKAAGLTQVDLEKKAGLPQSHISRLENGKHSPSFTTLEKISMALGIPVSTFDPCAP